MSETDLKPANSNPWYILMTLYGEQEGDRTDSNLAEKNRKAWNAWACQGMTAEAIEQLFKGNRIAREETQLTDAALAEMKKRFAKVWKERNGSSDVPNFPEPTEPIDLSKTSFFKKLTLKKLVFGSDVNFSGATFTQYADFSGATFTQNATFARATFTQDADFTDATFTQRAYFFDATFTQAAYFDGVTFTQDASFFLATFTQAAYFSDATFTQDADFSDATFTQDADFYNATFEAVAGFGHVTFGAEPSGTPALDFSGVQMNGPVNFERARFRHHYPKLTNATLHKSVQVTADEGHWPALPKPLNIFSGKSQHASIRNQSEAKEAAAKLRHAMAQQALPEEEHFFFRREMHHGARVGRFWTAGHMRLYELVSVFGHSIWRPGLLLLALMALGTIVYALETPQGIGESTGYSFATMFKFFGLQRTYFDLKMIETWPGWVQWFSASQTVVSYILLFFLGFGLRTRFRLR